ncbi:MAG: hypothetical protein NTV97_03455 [Alphaproteobacteria bacterium]|nr:hypothetical protein [Alphaproteobacteria bacterium]
MAVTLTWPTSLPAPSIARYQLKEQPNVDRTEVEMGAARQRRRGRQAPTEIPAQCELTKWQLMIFEGFWKHRAGEGTVWFNIELLGGLGLVNHEARFKSTEPPVATPHNGENFTVTFLLEVIERPIIGDSELTLMMDDDPEALAAAIASIHTAIHVTYP